ncbi:uncharacterized protein LOC130821195 [Amaranthus tricolor]|uniref:uncharacterized protein LOC130821195 n=1 Tax=Amaranthus tricolor TaxID=29722 RepID=UPI0025853B50|nr:uncharacterized protein LOC130821195 [Amaranthus tricolor]
MEGGIKFSIRELNSNVSLHREQLQQVKYLLDVDPGNSEYKDMEKELKEVIAVVEALLAKGNERFGSVIGTNASASDILQYSNSVAQYEMVDPSNLRSSNGDDADIDALLKAEVTKQALKRKISSAAVPDSQPRSTVKLRIKTKDPVIMNM